MRALIVVTHVRHVFASHRVSTLVSTSRMGSVRCSPSCSHRSSGSTPKSGAKSPKLATYSGPFAGRHGLVSSMVAGLHFSLRVRPSASSAETSTGATANAAAQSCFQCTPEPPGAQFRRGRNPNAKHPDSWNGFTCAFRDESRYPWREACSAALPVPSRRDGTMGWSPEPAYQGMITCRSGADPDASPPLTLARRPNGPRRRLPPGLGTRVGGTAVVARRERGLR